MISRAIDWLSYARNRSKAYQAGKLGLSLLVADGVITGPEETKSLTVAVWLVGCPLLHLASRNVPKSDG